MDNKFNNPHNNKFKNFLKKEGFYVVLFLCICTVATVAGVAVSRSKQNIEVSETAKATSSTSVSSDANSAQSVPDNAVEVKKNTDMAIVTNNATTKTELVNPVSGKVLIKYTGANGLISTKSGSRSMLGVYLTSKQNTNVLAAESGKVEKVETNSTHGLSVVINHNNGLKTTYANLSKALVKVGQEVKKSDAIAVTGNTSNLIYEIDALSSNPYSLFFEVEKQKDKNGNYVDVDPNEYIKNLEAQNN